MATTIFQNIRVFDGDKVLPSATVTIKDGKIASVSTDLSTSTPSDATVITGSNLTLLPGLIEAHMHAHLPPGAGSEILAPAIQCGITTCCDMHNNPVDVKKLKAACSASATLPDLKSAFFGATIEGGWPKPIVLREYSIHLSHVQSSVSLAPF